MTTPEDALKLDHQLCFALYAGSKELIKLYKPLLDPFGLTYTQYITLLVLWERDDLSVSELGGRLLLDSGTLTPLLKKLEQSQLLTRVRDSADERTVRVCLTEKGRALRQQFLDVPNRMFCSLGLAPQEALELKTLLEKLVKNLHEVNPE